MVRKPVSKIKVKVMEENSQAKLASGFHTNIHMHVYAPYIYVHMSPTHAHTKPQEKSVLHHKRPSIST